MSSRHKRKASTAAVAINSTLPGDTPSADLTLDRYTYTPATKRQSTNGHHLVSLSTSLTPFTPNTHHSSPSSSTTKLHPPKTPATPYHHDLLCPVCTQPFTDPLILSPCHHSVCRACLREWSLVCHKNQQYNNDVNHISIIGLHAHDIFRDTQPCSEDEMYDVINSIDQSELCHVCMMEDENDNALIACDGCDMWVHQLCYGIQHIPPKEVKWFCDWCTYQQQEKERQNKHRNGRKHRYRSQMNGSLTAIEAECCVCPNRDDKALKPVHNSDRWIHVSCAYWLPSCGFDDELERNSVYGVENIERERMRLTCMFCKERGAGLQCSYGRCMHAYHIPCALRAGLRFELRTLPEPSGDHENHQYVIPHSFCFKHFNKSSEVEIVTSNHRRNSRENNLHTHTHTNIESGADDDDDNVADNDNNSRGRRSRSSSNGMVQQRIKHSKDIVRITCPVCRTGCDVNMKVENLGLKANKRLVEEIIAVKAKLFDQISSTQKQHSTKKMSQMLLSPVGSKSPRTALHTSTNGVHTRNHNNPNIHILSTLRKSMQSNAPTSASLSTALRRRNGTSRRIHMTHMGTSIPLLSSTGNKLHENLNGMDSEEKSSNMMIPKFDINDADTNQDNIATSSSLSSAAEIFPLLSYPLQKQLTSEQSHEHAIKAVKRIMRLVACYKCVACDSTTNSNKHNTSSKLMECKECDCMYCEACCDKIHNIHLNVARLSIAGHSFTTYENVESFVEIMTLRYFNAIDASSWHTAVDHWKSTLNTVHEQLNIREVAIKRYTILSIDEMIDALLKQRDAILSEVAEQFSKQRKILDSYSSALRSIAIKEGNKDKERDSSNIEENVEANSLTSASTSASEEDQNFVNSLKVEELCESVESGVDIEHVKELNVSLLSDGYRLPREEFLHAIAEVGLHPCGALHEIQSPDEGENGDESVEDVVSHSEYDDDNGSVPMVDAHEDTDDVRDER